MRFFIIIVTATFLAGCGLEQRYYTFDYPHNSKTLFRIDSPTQSTLTAAVQPLKDLRPKTNKGMMDAALLFCYGKSHYERPEIPRTYHITMDVDTELTTATITSMQNSGLFKTVYLSMGGPVAGNTNIIARGQIDRFLFERSTIFYCPIIGFIPFLFGAPMGHLENRVAGQIEFVDAASMQVIHTYKFDKSRKETLYLGHPADQQSFMWYPMLYQEAMNEMLNEISDSNIFKDVEKNK